MEIAFSRLLTFKFQQMLECLPCPTAEVDVVSLQALCHLNLPFL